MADINNLSITGRLVGDAEIKESTKGLTICKFSIANNYTRRVENGRAKEVNFFDLAIFDKKAKGLFPFLKQGVLVGIEAEIRQNRWEKDEKMWISNELFVRKIELLSAPKKSKEGIKENSDDYSSSGNGDDQLEIF